MLEISFGWTWPAFVARAKTVTRRDWSSKYAERFPAGTEFTALDRNRRVGGGEIGQGRVVSDVEWQPLANMPDSDYDAEGFAWLFKHPEVLPRQAKAQIWGDCSREAFERWRNSGSALWVVRYEILNVAEWAVVELASRFELRQGYLFGRSGFGARPCL